MKRRARRTQIIANKLAGVLHGDVVVQVQVMAEEFMDSDHIKEVMAVSSSLVRHSIVASVSGGIVYFRNETE